MNSNRDNIKRFQIGGSELSEEALITRVNEIETSIAENGRKIKAEGGRGIAILPGVEKLLTALRKGGARWGIVTSATFGYASSATQTAGIVPPPPPFLIAAENCTEGKPFPEPYFKGIEALRKLGGPEFLASDVLVLEDAPSGLASGLAAGCRTLAVCTGQSREIIRKVEATYKVSTLEQVEVLSVENGVITLKITTLEEEEADDLANGRPLVK